MKYITITHDKTDAKNFKDATTILSMANVQTVEFLRGGSGAKSNPYTYQLSIAYANGEVQTLDFKKDSGTANAARRAIFEALQNDNDVVILGY